MGEVYRAHDTKLHRDVAIKVLLPAVAADAERLARLTREAQVLASLNHPHIAAIYGLEDSSGVPALVMELVDGPTLADRIALGPVPLEEALPIARQIVEALETAHEQGIIHRDLKPANIKVRSDGTVKVLDFGLAKALEPVGSSKANLTQSPTITSPAMLTSVGVILGTAAYMSPEQAAGKPADKRSDLWAFGVVLLEMLTGRQVFTGETVSHVLAAVLKTEPEWSTLPEETPAAIHRLLRRSLEKDRKRRLDSAAAARLEIDDVLSGSLSVWEATPPPAMSRSTLWHRLLPAIGGALLFGLIVAATMWASLRPRPQQVVRLAATTSGEVGDTYPGTDVAISPDGRHIVYTTGTSPDTQQLFIRPLHQLDITALDPGLHPVDPFMSPDSQWVGFVEATTGTLTLKKVSLTGGVPVTICTSRAPIRGASWGDDDRIVFGTISRGEATGGLFRVPAAGGPPEVLTKLDSSKGEAGHILPAVLPGGRGVLFTITPTNGRVDDHQIAALDLATGRTKVLIVGGSGPRYASSGHLVYAATGSLRAVPFDVDRLEVHGSGVPVVERIAVKGPFGVASFDMTGDGTLIYRTGGSEANTNRVLVWVDRQGHEEPVGAPARAYTYPRLSPDGTRIALDIRDPDNDISIWDFARQSLTPLTFDPGPNRGVAWSANGKRIAFSAKRDGIENIYWQAADGTGTAERLTDGPDAQIPWSFTPDGTGLFFTQSPTGDGPFDIGLVSLTGDRRATLLLHGSEDEMNPEISPDGRWLAYQLNDSKQWEIYVRPFPDLTGGKWKVSTDGGTRPAWSPSGNELFYNQRGVLVAVPLQPGPTFTFGAPHVVVEGRYVNLTGRTYDVSSDGKRFLMIKDATRSSTTAPSQLVVVQNFFEELKRLVPTK